MSALGSLVVSLALDHTNFSNGLGKSEYDAKKSAENIKKTFDTLKSGLATLGGLVGVGGFTSLISSSIDAADNLNDLSLKTGATVSSLASLKLIAENSGTSLEEVGRGINKLTLWMAENGSEARKLGIDAQDPVQAFIQFAAALEKTEGAGRRAQLANNVFGKSYADLLPLLSEGSAGISAATKASGEFAAHMEHLAPLSDKFKDNLGHLKQFSDLAAASLVDPLIPSLTETAVRMVEIAEKGNYALAVLRGFAGIGKVPLDLVFGDSALSQMDASVDRQVKDLQQKLSNLTRHRRDAEGQGLLHQWLHGSKADMDREIEVTKNQIAALVQYADRLRAPREDEKPKEKSASGAKVKATKPQRISAAEWSMEESAHLIRTHYQIQQEASEAYTAQLRNEFDAEWALIELQDDQYRSGRDAAARWTDAIDPMQKYRDDLEEIARLEREGHLTAEKALAAQFLVHEQMDKALAANNEALKEQNDIARELGLTFTSAFEDAMVSGKKLGQVMAGVAQDLYRLFLRKTVSEPAMGWFSSTLAGSGLGNLFGNWFNSSAASNLTAFSSMDFGSINAFSTAFARGGIMTDRGPLPLHTYASGGIADRPQLAVFGEGRRPEAYVPLPDGRSIPVTMQGGGGVTIVQHIAIDARGADAGVDQKIRLAMKQAVDAAEYRINDSLARAGRTARLAGLV